MALGIYKSDQGYYTRFVSTIAVGTIAGAGAAWLWQELAVFNSPYVQAIGVLALLLVMGAFIFWIYWSNKRTVEFFIATEGELKKVNWSTRREVFGSTWVVIIVAASIAIILFTVDLLFAEIFKMAGVLYGDSVVIEFFQSLGS